MVDPLELLRRYAGLPETERALFAFENPALLRREILDSLSHDPDPLQEIAKQALEPALEELQVLLQRLENGERKYRLGVGPFELIATRIYRGEIAPEYAEELARAPEIVMGLAPVYVQILCSYAGTLIEDGEWRRAVQLWRLLVTAADQSPDGPEALQIRRAIGLAWVEIVTRAVTDIPDGRLFRKAVQVGDDLLALAQADIDGDFMGKMSHWLGVLHLDPYTAGRNSENYIFQIQIWKQRLYNEYGEGLPGFSDQEISEMQMPEPQEALQKAELYLRQAIQYSKGDEKGISLKALLDTLVCCESLGLQTNPNEYLRIGQEALNFLDPVASVHERLAIMNVLQSAGLAIDPCETQRFFAIPLGEYLRQFSPALVIGLVLQASGVFSAQEPWKCLEYLAQARDLFDEYADEMYRRLRLDRILTTIETRLSPQRREIKKDADLFLSQIILERLAQQTGMDKVVESAGMISLAVQSTAVDREDIGLHLLQVAADVAPDFWAKFNDAFLFFKGNLNIGVAVSALHGKDLPTAVEAYFEAIVSFGGLHFRDQTIETLKRLDDIILNAGIDNSVAVRVLMGLARLAFRLESVFGQSATDLVQKLLLHTFYILDIEAANPEAINLLFQIGKGLRFSATVRYGASYDAVADEVCSDLLKQINHAGPVSLQIDGDAALNQNLLLSAYVQAGERQSGDTPEERLMNIQQSFDAYLNSQLLSRITDESPSFLKIEDIKNTLDEKSILLNYYLGSSPKALLAIVALLFTRQNMRVSVIQLNFPLSHLSVSYEDKRVFMTPIALSVADLRDEIVADPGPLHVTPKAREILNADRNLFLSGLIDPLNKLHQSGKDHLIIVPHGPLHYYPFHLLGEYGQTLADQWKVTYLPNLSLLARKRTGTKPSPLREITSFGLSFEQENRFGHDPLPEAAREANAVAKIFNCEPVLDPQATKKAFIKALQSSRYVHISTHGKHNVNAAFFQCLFLSPDGESDGRLYAYELLPLDLSGLELLTLSACETALGRFDNADNLRGLPAAFLLAGVQTIVGTLWEVGTQPAELFFSAFYRKVKAKNGTLDAFYTAQQETRGQFPQYRDWGPFYLIGQTN